MTLYIAPDLEAEAAALPIREAAGYPDPLTSVRVVVSRIMTEGGWLLTDDKGRVLGLHTPKREDAEPSTAPAGAGGGEG